MATTTTSSYRRWLDLHPWQLTPCINFFINIVFYFIGLTTKYVEVFWYFQPLDLVERGSFQETVPNSEPIGILKPLKLYEYLVHTSTKTQVRLKGGLFQSHFKEVLACVCVVIPCSVEAESSWQIGFFSKLLWAPWSRSMKCSWWRLFSLQYHPQAARGERSDHHKGKVNGSCTRNGNYQQSYCW